MTFPIQITFRAMEASSALEDVIRSKAMDLEKYYDRVVRCRVIVEAPSPHHRQGMGYHVTVELSIPGQDIVASRDPAEPGGYEDAYIAIRDTFRAARDELKSQVGRQREQARERARITEELNP